MLKTEPNVDHSKMLKSEENMYNIIRVYDQLSYLCASNTSLINLEKFTLSAVLVGREEYRISECAEFQVWKFLHLQKLAHGLR